MTLVHHLQRLHADVDAFDAKRSCNKVHRRDDGGDGQYQAADDDVFHLPAVAGTLSGRVGQPVVPVSDVLYFGKVGNIDVLDDQRLGKLRHLAFPPKFGVVLDRTLHAEGDLSASMFSDPFTLQADRGFRSVNGFVALFSRALAVLFFTLAFAGYVFDYSLALVLAMCLLGAVGWENARLAERDAG